jgi:outer membrane protein assembly factor BamB
MTDRPAGDEGEPSADTATQAESQPDRAAEVDGPPARPGVLSALWASRRRRAVLAAAAVVVLAAVVTVVATNSGAERPVPSGEMPTLGSQFATPPASGTSTPATAALPMYSGAPLWTFSMSAGIDDSDLPGFAVTDHGFVIRMREEILGLDRAGKQVWRYTPANATEFSMRASGPTVFVSYDNPDEDRWPQPEIIIALDAATGTEIWREAEASFWTVTTDTIYLSVCYGGQNNHIGDCTFSARDPRTNRARWSVPTYAAASVINDEGDSPQAVPPPPVLLIEAYPIGHDSDHISAYDPATGAPLGSGFKDADGDAPSAIDIATELTLVTVDEDDENPANGCSATLTGYSVAGATQSWQYVARTAKSDDGRECGRLPVSYNGDKLAVTSANGMPSVLNLNTGAVEWSAPVAGAAVAARGTALLAVTAAADGTAELVAYQVGNPEPIWRAPFRGGLDNLEGWTVVITDSLAVAILDGGEAVGYDLKSGKAWSYLESVQEVTDTWFAVCGGGACRGYGLG